jgi:hypothetical protein
LRAGRSWSMMTTTAPTGKIFWNRYLISFSLQIFIMISFLLLTIISFPLHLNFSKFYILRWLFIFFIFNYCKKVNIYFCCLQFDIVIILVT